MKQRSIVGVLIFFVLLLAVVLVVVISGLDRVAPEIMFPDETITYEEGQSESVLLEDVKAIDEHDGNVSKLLVVETVYDFNDGTGKVVYVAKDLSGNMVKKERVINYIASTVDEPENADSENDTDTEDEETTTTQADNAAANNAPVMVLSETSVSITAGQSFNALNYVADITDDKDDRNDLFRKIQVYGQYDAKKAGTYTINYRVVDSDGNSSEPVSLTLEVKGSSKTAAQPSGAAQEGQAEQTSQDGENAPQGQ